MKRLFLTILACLIASSAFAGSLTITVAVGSPAINLTKTFTIPDADLTGKFAPWMQSAYAAPPCVPIAPVTTCTTTPFTLAQSYAAWAAGVMAGEAANVTQYQQQQAISAITPVVPVSAQ